MLIVPLAINVLNDNTSLDSQQSLCPFKMATGFPCPGCGITKSFLSIYQKKWEQAFHYHLFGPFVFLFLVVFIVFTSVEVCNKKELFFGSIFPKKIGLFLGVFLMIYHAIRIISFVHQYSFQQILQQSVWR